MTSSLDTVRGVRGPTILLSSGRYFDFTEPTPLTIDEVAHGLSNLCRFTGQCRTFYSVAQHSAIVSKLLPDHLAWHGLLHDAVEAVVGDMVSPLKRLIPGYSEIEARCEAVILAGFGITGPMPPEVKQADLMALRIEQRDLMNADDHVWTWTEGLVPPSWNITPMSPQVAKRVFLSRVEYLRREGVAA